MSLAEENYMQTVKSMVSSMEITSAEDVNLNIIAVSMRNFTQQFNDGARKFYMDDIHAPFQFYWEFNNARERAVITEPIREMLIAKYAAAGWNITISPVEMYMMDACQVVVKSSQLSK